MIVVISKTHQHAWAWCAQMGVNPNDREVVFIHSATDARERLAGVQLTPDDQIDWYTIPDDADAIEDEIYMRTFPRPEGPEDLKATLLSLQEQLEEL